jgi:hypothetical protein
MAEAVGVHGGGLYELLKGSSSRVGRSEFFAHAIPMTLDSLFDSGCAVV